MPQQKNKENWGLPPRWRYRKGSYYYRPAPKDRHLWGGKQEYWLGHSLEEAHRNFSDMSGRLVTLPPVLETEVLLKMRESHLPCHVYLLFDGDECVYVGQTHNLHSRLKSHHVGVDLWSSYVALPCPKEALAAMETQYISALRPRYNMKQKDADRAGLREIVGTEGSEVGTPTRSRAYLDSLSDCSWRN